MYSMLFIAVTQKFNVVQGHMYISCSIILKWIVRSLLVVLYCHDSTTTSGGMFFGRHVPEGVVTVLKEREIECSVHSPFVPESDFELSN